MGKFNWLVNNTEWNFYEKCLSFCQIFFKETEFSWPFLEYIDLLKRKNCVLRYSKIVKFLSWNIFIFLLPNDRLLLKTKIIAKNLKDLMGNFLTFQPP